MYAFVTILIILDCFLLGLIVLIQNPKGGGLSSSFGGVGQQLLGARRSTDVVEKLTWGFAAALIILCLSTSFFVDKKGMSKKEVAPKSEIEQNMMKNPYSAPSTIPQQQKPAGPATNPNAPK